MPTRSWSARLAARRLALYVEDHEMAAQVLEGKGFVLYTEKDLNTEPEGFS